MPTFRAYVDKKIDPQTQTGGDHSRVIDDEATNEFAFEQSLKLEDDEQLNQIVSLYTGNPEAGLIQADVLTRAVASELMAEMDLSVDDAMAIARSAVAKSGGAI